MSSRDEEKALIPSDVIAMAVISALCPTNMSARAPPAKVYIIAIIFHVLRVE